MIGTVSVEGDARTITVGCNQLRGLISVANDLYGTLSFKKKILAGQSPTPPGRVFIGHDVTATGGILVGKPAFGSEEALGADMDGVISIGRDLAGTLRVVSRRKQGGPILGGNMPGEVYVGSGAGGGDLSGVLDVDSTLAGTVTVAGNLTGQLLVGTSVDDDLTGVIDIQGDCAGLVDVTGVLHDPSADRTAGQIRVAGAFDATGAGDAIDVHGGIPTGEDEKAFICFNYDGEGHDGHDVWYNGSSVYLGAVQYTAPNSAARIYCPVPSHGQGDCDGVCHEVQGEVICVDFADIDPFVALIPYDPEVDEPALQVAVPFMGDINCDGAVDFGDIDPFVALIPGPCGPPCGQQLLGGGQMEMMVMEGGTLGGQAALADAITQAVVNGDPPSGPEYWESVFNSFGEQ